jgi:hypothetical protein
MDQIFDVFQLQSDNRMIWVERFTGVDEAKRYAEKLHATSEAKYVIYSVMERRILRNLVPGL